MAATKTKQKEGDSERRRRGRERERRGERRRTVFAGTVCNGATQRERTNAERGERVVAVGE